MQAPRFKDFSFHPFALFYNGYVAPEVDVRECDAVDALVIALVV